MQAVNVVALRKDTDGAQMQELRGSSPAVQRVRRAIERARAVDAPVLIVGEAGTGKSLVARMIHRGSARRDEPFVEVGCAATTQLPFEASSPAQTIVLDDVSALPSDVQMRLARLIDASPSVRVIACSTGDLDGAVQRRAFRVELLHRLNTLTIRLPSLVARSRADFEDLLQRFVLEQPRKIEFARGAIDWLTRRGWPANVRELRNVVQRLSIMSERHTIDVSILEELVGRARGTAESDTDVFVDATLRAPAPPLGRLRAIESAMIERAIALTNNESEAARLLGVPRRVMLRRHARLTKGASASDDE